MAIFDALAGVQAQTITVWNQSERYHFEENALQASYTYLYRYAVPRLAYLNKMDREGVSVQDTLDIFYKYQLRQAVKFNTATNITLTSRFL